MKEIMELGSAPCDEDCAQVGIDGYESRMQKEVLAFVRMLKRSFPEAKSNGCNFRYKIFQHDFGMYKEAIVEFNPNSITSSKYIEKIEDELPVNWDKEAREEIEKGYYT